MRSRSTKRSIRITAAVVFVCVVSYTALTIALDIRNPRPIPTISIGSTGALPAKLASPPASQPSLLSIDALEANTQNPPKYFYMSTIPQTPEQRRIARAEFEKSRQPHEWEFGTQEFLCYGIRIGMTASEIEEQLPTPDEVQRDLPNSTTFIPAETRNLYTFEFGPPNVNDDGTTTSNGNREMLNVFFDESGKATYVLVVHTGLIFEDIPPMSIFKLK